MTIIKALSVVAVLSTVIAAPVFARDAEPARHHNLRIHRGPAHHRLGDQYFRGAYNQRNEFYDPYRQFGLNTEGFGGRDPSRIGGEDPDLHPSAY
ncbi:hypothetical protein [Bradyrhizobium sp.]|uniref:hypothetical protein n=1 Tax=Bradyrhizobium sp. TaxID=376 RepID=UPI003C591A71